MREGTSRLVPIVDLRGSFGLEVVEYVATRDASSALFAERTGVQLLVPHHGKGWWVPCRKNVV